MRGIYYTALCMLLVLIFTSQVKAENRSNTPRENINEATAIKKIELLPEVKRFMKNAKRSEPLIMLARSPDATFKYYWIKVGISNFDMYRTTYNFYVDAKTAAVYYYDPITDLGQGNLGEEIIPLKQWRQRNHHHRK